MFGISSMANGVVKPGSGLNPFPRMHPSTRNEETSTPLRQLHFSQSKCLGFWFRLADGFKEKKWAASVGAPLSDATFHEDGDEVDPSAGIPLFDLGDIRAAIPKHCWVKNLWKFMSYVVRDVAVVAGLVSLAVKLDCWVVCLFYWCAQSTMFLDLFDLGCDCGHGSFSDNSKLNSIIGHVLHSSVLVPFHAWRIGHRTHHQNIQTRYENVEFCHPWSNGPGKMGFHYNLNSKLFLPYERRDVLASIACWIAMVALIVALSFVIGPIQMLKLYGVPYLGFLALATHLNHYSHEDKLPGYKDKSLIETANDCKSNELCVLVKSFKNDHYVILGMLSIIELMRS